MESERRKPRPERPTFVQQRKMPKPLNNEGRWIVARRHPEKSYVEAWQWIQGGEPEPDPEFLALPKTREEAKNPLMRQLPGFDESGSNTERGRSAEEGAKDD